MAGRLATFLDQAGRTAFAWDRLNCLLFPADWCVACGRADPAADYRGRFRTELGARRLARAAGGLEALADAAMAQAGYARAAAAKAGDVGLVQLADLSLGAIWTGELWAMVTRGGLLLLPAPATRIWSV